MFKIYCTVYTRPRVSNEPVIAPFGFARIIDWLSHQIHDMAEEYNLVVVWLYYPRHKRM